MSDNVKQTTCAAKHSALNTSLEDIKKAISRIEWGILLIVLYFAGLAIDGIVGKAAEAAGGG